MNFFSWLFETGSNRYQIDDKYTFGKNSQYIISQRILATFVGLIGFGLPIMLCFSTKISWPLQTCFYDSVSHFYYAKFFGDIFVISLAVIGTFLLAYRGGNRHETRFATVAGFAAIGVALFPTENSGCDDPLFSARGLANFSQDIAASKLEIAEFDDGELYFQLFAVASSLHYVFAAVLFAFLAYYCLRVFTRVDMPDQQGKYYGMTLVKFSRNILYIGSGLLIIVAMVLLGSNTFFGNGDDPLSWWKQNNITFWLEAISLMAFGFSWMVKGRFFGAALMDEHEEKQIVG